jgi:hypothetical protein
MFNINSLEENFMKLWKSSVVFIGITILVLSSLTASAETITDGTGDVYHWTQTGTSWSWKANIGDKPNIDITQIYYTVSENQLTLTMKVVGTIQNSDNIIYWVYYNSTDTSYWMSWSNGTGFGYAMITQQEGETGNFELAENVTASGNTLSATFNILGDTSNVKIWGWAHEYTEMNNVAKEWWGDWAPNTEFPYQIEPNGGTQNNTDGNNSNDSGTQKKTPGFELIIVVCSIAMILLWKRKRMN